MGDPCLGRGDSNHGPAGVEPGRRCGPGWGGPPPGGPAAARGMRSMDGVQADVVVIGGGPAGVSAALRARELGATVALVEQGELGGTCTNDGCVPTRVLAKAARLVRDAEQFADYGLEGAPPTV